eukprot:gene31082-41397_t
MQWILNKYVSVSGSEPHSVWNPLQFIKGKCKQSDFVAFKLDIDHEITESAIVNQLQSDEEAQSLIDEFYYEQHFRLLQLRYPTAQERISNPLLAMIDIY